MPKLFEVPRNTRIVLPDGMELNFHHIDGMYSYCEDDNGNVMHLAAWTDVNIKGEDNEKDSCNASAGCDNCQCG